MRGGSEERLAVLLARAGDPKVTTAVALEARHCWVIDPPGWPGRWPGLLHRWQRSELGWLGVVTMAVIYEGQQIVVFAELPAAVLEAP
jgi:hypothetical protein